MEKLRIMSVFGTRPEAIKMAPLVKELASRDEIESLCCVTAQHREMLDSVMEVFDLKADCDLDIMTPRQTLSTITSKCLLGMDDAIEQLKPDMILVHGDTSTTFAGALSAFYHKVPVGHVEAGLRTYDKYSPFPEEMNRKLVTAIADLYFCPTKNNRENLLKEGVTEGLFITGNTVIDALKTTVRKDYRFTTELLNELDYSRKVVLVTCHRRENYGQPMENIMTALRDIALQNEFELQLPVVEAQQPLVSPYVQAFPVVRDHLSVGPVGIRQEVRDQVGHPYERRAVVHEQGVVAAEPHTPDAVLGDAVDASVIGGLGHGVEAVVRDVQGMERRRNQRCGEKQRRKRNFRICLMSGHRFFFSTKLKEKAKNGCFEARFFGSPPPDRARGGESRAAPPGD